MAIPIAQQRKLLQRSGNMCAFPDCKRLLTSEGSPDDPVVVLGEIAHIVGESPDGPRGKSPLTLKQRNTYQNTILLCNQHHQLIDSDGALATYTVERLTAMKEDHEKWVERTLGGGAMSPLSRLRWCCAIKSRPLFPTVWTASRRRPSGRVAHPG